MFGIVCMDGVNDDDESVLDGCTMFDAEVCLFLMTNC